MGKQLKTINQVKTYFFLSFFYFLAHGLILIDEGIYWDDWFLLDNNKQLILNNFQESGLPVNGYLHIWLISLPNPVFIYNLVTFTCYLGAGLFLYRFLRIAGFLTSKEAIWIAIIFLVVPQNLARNAMINLPYAICNFLFFVGLWVFQQFVLRKKGAVCFRLLALFLFYTSFLTNSLLVFYFIVPLYLFFLFKPKSIKEVLNVGFRFTDFLILPLCFWIIKLVYFPTSGIYFKTHYNEITKENIFKAPARIIRTFKSSFWDMLVDSWKAFLDMPFGVVILIIGVILVFIVLVTNHRHHFRITYKRAIILFSLGILLFAISAFPYLAVGLYPMEADWLSRHQLLLPLGTAFILYYGIELLLGQKFFFERIKLIVLCLFVGSFIVKDQMTYLAYQRDWMKQESLMLHLNEYPEVLRLSNLKIEDETRNMNVFWRYYRNYEFEGIINKVNSENRRFDLGLMSKNQKINIDKTKSTKIFQLKDKMSPDAILILKKGTFYPDTKDIIRLKFCKLFHNGDWQNEIRKMLEVEVLFPKSGII